MNSEKVKEIKKALECCRHSIKDGCEPCPYHNPNEDCQEILIWKMEDYINELESDKERLLESCKNCHYIKDLEIANGHTKELKDRITELEKENENIKTQKNVCKKQLERLLKENQQFKDQIADLEQENEILEGTKGRITFADRINLVHNAIEIKLKQFAERLKEMPFNIEFTFKESSYEDIKTLANLMKEYSVRYIDETLKECINEQQKNN